MAKKLHVHKVSLTQKRRANKRVNDIRNKGIEKKSISEVFNVYYKDQIKALYDAVRREA